MSEFLTVREAAEFLHCHVNTIRKAINAGKLKAGSIGPKGYRISEEELKNFLYKGDEQEEEAPHAS